MLDSNWSVGVSIWGPKGARRSPCGPCPEQQAVGVEAANRVLHARSRKACLMELPSPDEDRARANLNQTGGLASLAQTSCHTSGPDRNIIRVQELIT
ncbi:hypothetical protein NEUTE2DRAFT_51772 [Neurospora tetrasperma FGSC 2509]|nr:hypothetical protein NEUTE2DRAFT_51772 [Neurospora tetrasperma FGSC 2509]